MTKRALWPLGIGIVLLCLAGWAAYARLFREQQVEADDASVTLKWRWGIAREMLLDEDNDGDPERIFIFAGNNTRFYTDITPTEGFIDSDNDGKFDVHVRWKESAIFEITRDVNGDGDIDLRLMGSEAADYFQQFRQRDVDKRPQR